MKIAIHQPNYLPYLGFFDKMKQSDIFVIYDDAQFNKEDFQHRNRIRIYHGWKYLTIPVEKKHIPIKDIMIKNRINENGNSWQEAHLKDVMDNYKVASYFSTYYENLKEIYTSKYEKLIDLNIDIINFMKDSFRIKTKTIFASELGFISKSTEKLVDIVEYLGGNIYLSGPAGRNYIDVSLFENRGISVEFQDFKHPIYPQRYKGFIPNMSAIDVMFNIGKLI